MILPFTPSPSPLTVMDERFTVPVLFFQLSSLSSLTFVTAAFSPSQATSAPKTALTTLRGISTLPFSFTGGAETSRTAPLTMTEPLPTVAVTDFPFFTAVTVLFPPFQETSIPSFSKTARMGTRSSPLSILELASNSEAPLSSAATPSPMTLQGERTRADDTSAADRAAQMNLDLIPRFFIAYHSIK